MLAVELIGDALQLTGILSEIDSVSAEQGATGTTILNDLMASLEEDGIDLGYAPIPDSNGEVLLPPGQIGAVKYLLALLLAAHYGVQVQPLIAAIAANGHERLLRQSVISKMRTIKTGLPRGDAQVCGVDIVTL
jgi:hypothetical protein